MDFVRNIFADVVAHWANWLLIGAGSLLLGALRKRWKGDVAEIVLYGMIGAATVSVLVVTWPMITRTAQSPPPTIAEIQTAIKSELDSRDAAANKQPTTDEIRTIIRDWADRRHYEVRNDEPKGDEDFHMMVRVDGPLHISTLKGPEPQPINIDALISVSPEHTKMITDLPEKDSLRFFQKLGLELLRFGMAYEIRFAKSDDGAAGGAVLIEDKIARADFGEKEIERRARQVSRSVEVVKKMFALELIPVD